MLHFATLFDINYLNRGLALLNSLKMHSSVPFKLFVLALDEIASQKLKNLNIPEIEIITLEEIEKWHPGLLSAKKNRSPVEYYFTLSPALPLYILSTFQNIEFITTLDADILFFNDPKIIFDDFDSYSVQITPHNFPKKLSHLNVAGLYNVSFQTFRNDSTGRTCLQWWLDQCIEWCYDKVETNRYADQKYLDEFENLFPGMVQILNQKGVGVAPWNVDNYTVSKGSKSILIDDEPLIYYHYHRFRSYNNYLFSFGLQDFKVTNLSQTEINIIYKPYIAAIKATNEVNFDKKITRYQKNENSSWINYILYNQNVFFYLNNSICFNIGKYATIIHGLYGKLLRNKNPKQ